MAYIQDVQESVPALPEAGNLTSFVVLSQNENGRRLNFKIVGVDIPSGSTATFSGTKPDGVVYSTTGTISGNIVTVNEDVQMTAVAGSWDAKIRVLNGGNVIASAKVRMTIDADPVAPGSIPSDSQLDGIVAECQAYAESARSDAYGSPLTALTAADMIDKTRVYVYTGSETGYNSGHWYYWDGTAWTDGGVYNSTAFETDTTLTIAGMAADAKAAGDEITDIKEDLTLKADLPTETIENVAIASFTDGAEDVPVKELKVAIEPIQDLHGYDNPWPAGGGKNKFNMDFENTTINGTAIARQSDGRVSTSGAPSSAFDFVVGHVPLKAGSYILNGCPSGGGSSTYRLQVTDYPVVNNLGQDSGSGVSFTLEQDMEIAVRIQIYPGSPASVEFKPMIRLASESDSTFAPYSNICPISGRDSVTVTRTGLNGADSQTYPISLSSTIYGGTLDVGTGVLTVTHGFIESYNGETLPSTWISDRDVYAEGTTPTTGAEVVYALATPTTVQLTPAQVTTLLKDNNIFADSGDVKKLIYRADLGAYIEKLINA